MMRQMRENTKWIMLITAAAFVALMVFEWGMDASGQSGGGGSLGEVGRTSVSVQHYQNVYRNLYDQVQRSQERPISSAQNREVEDMAWNEVVNQLLIESELDRRGIGVSDEEIRQAVRTSPPAEFRSDPNFQTDGQFDPQRYQQFLQQAGQDPQFLMQLEQYYRDVIPRSKLMRQVTSGVWVSDRELWQDWRDRNETVEVTFVDLRPDVLVPDSEVEVSPAEIDAYYEEHRDDYQVPARAQVRYTYISASPTAADSTAARDRAEEIRARLVAEEEDFADVAAIESADDATAADGGSLGTITRGEMPPAFEEVAFSLPVGDISEPFETEFGLHIIEVLSRDEDEAEVRQILLELERTADSEIR
ncbi:MAG: SurA N-terminal domain-containing protein, partial [Gemmatimonadota bacterium]